MLLVGFGVGRVLLEELRRARLNLGVKNHLPELLCGHALAPLALLLVACLERLECRTVAVRKARALVGTHERPHALVLDTLHEEVGNPEAVEEVARTLLLSALVELHAEEVLDVRVPRLKLDSEGAVALAALVDVARRVVENAEHGDDARRLAVRPGNASVAGANVVDIDADAAGPLGNLRAVAERLVDARDAVLGHLEEEARRELGMGRPRVEERGGRVDKVAEREAVLRLLDAVKVYPVNLDGHAHPEVLRALLAAEELALLERLEAELVKEEIAVVVNHGLISCRVVADEVMLFVRDERSMVLELLNAIQERRRRVLLVVVNDDAGRELAVVRVVARLHHGTGLRGKLVELARLHTVTKLRADLLRNDVGIDVVEPLGEGPDALENLVKRNRLAVTVALHDEEMVGHFSIPLPRHTLKRDYFSSVHFGGGHVRTGHNSTVRMALRVWRSSCSLT